MSLCFHLGDYYTNGANLMRKLFIHADNGIGQIYGCISGDIWLKVKLQSMFLLTMFDSAAINCVKVSSCCIEPLCSTNQFVGIWNSSWLLSHTIYTPQRHLSYGAVGGFTVCKFFTESCVEVCRLITQGGVFTVFLACPMGVFFSCNEASWTRKLSLKQGVMSPCWQSEWGFALLSGKGRSLRGVLFWETVLFLNQTNLQGNDYKVLVQELTITV